MNATTSDSLAPVVYSQQLQIYKMGVALWFPEPDDAPAEVEIGDVGFIWDGSFTKLFNATVPADAPQNRNGVPRGFTPLTFNRERLTRKREEILKDGPLCSRSVRRVDVETHVGSRWCIADAIPYYSIDSHVAHSTAGAGARIGISFKCMRDKGALLVLNDGGADQEVLKPNTAFPDYMNKHHDSWFAFAQENQHAVRPGDIIMVRGTIKARKWTVAAFIGEETEQSLHFDAHGIAPVAFGASLRLATTSSASVLHRSGPTSTTSLKNQCIFLSRYKMKRRLFRAPKAIHAAGYPGDDRRLDDDEESVSQENSEVEDDFGHTKTADLLDILLEYILENSQCDTAIASDDDLNVLGVNSDGTTPQEFGAQLQTSQPPISISADSVAYVTLSTDESSVHDNRRLELESSQVLVESPALGSQRGMDNLTSALSSVKVSNTRDQLFSATEHSLSAESSARGKQRLTAGELISQRAENLNDLEGASNLVIGKGQLEPPGDDTSRAKALQARFTQLGAIDDLNESIHCFTNANNITSDIDPNKPSRLVDLGRSLLLRYEIYGGSSADDLAGAITSFAHADSLTSFEHPLKVTIITELGRARLFKHRPEDGGCIDGRTVVSRNNETQTDLLEAITLLTRAADLTDDNDSSKPAILRDLGWAQALRLHNSSIDADYSQAVVALTELADDNPMPSRLTDVGRVRVLRYLRTQQQPSDSDDLEAAIKALELAVNLTPDADPLKPSRLMDLGDVQFYKHLCTDAIQSFTCAVELLPVGHPLKPVCFWKMGQALSKFHAERIGSDATGVEVITDAYTRSVSLLPDGHPHKWSRRNQIEMVKREWSHRSMLRVIGSNISVAKLDRN